MAGSNREDNTFDDGAFDAQVPYEFNMDDLFPSGMSEESASGESTGTHGEGEGATAHDTDGMNGPDAVNGTGGDSHESGEDAHAQGAETDDLAQFEREFGQATQADFDAELDGLIGNKAKAAMLITGLVSAELLTAFCSLTDIAADCMADEHGAVAVLRNLDGDAPEAAASSLSRMVSGMPVVLAVNRADKLASTLYMDGEAGQEFAPPVLFASSPRFVEDVMLGIVSLADLQAQGQPTFDSSSMGRLKAMRTVNSFVRQAQKAAKAQERAERDQDRGADAGTGAEDSGNAGDISGTDPADDGKRS